MEFENVSKEFYVGLKVGPQQIIMNEFMTFNIKNFYYVALKMVTL